jgi:hypothetical protein
MLRQWLKIRLFFSTLFIRPKSYEQKGFVYEEFDEPKFRELPVEEQGKEVQKNWNKYMREK